jgi:D-alanine-D-alanine ligase
MIVGLTYDLRDAYLAEGFSEDETAEFDRISTIEAFEDALGRLGYQTDRIGHARDLIGRLASGDRWDLVFNIAEGMYGLGREAQVPAILDVYNIPYTFADPVVAGLTLHKALTKRVLRDAGLPTPDFFVVERDEDIAAVDLPMPLFAKPLAEGTGKGITPASRIEDRPALEQVCRELLTRYRQPVLVERFLPGREFTVGLVGTGPQAEAIGTLEVALRPEAEEAVYSYVNKERCEELVDYLLVTEAEIDRQARQLSLDAWRVLGCRDGGRIDLRADADGRLSILEVNPLAGMHPEHSDLPILATKLGIDYLDLMDRILRSALDRAGLTPPARPGP